MSEYIDREAAKKEFNIHFGDVHDAVIANRIIDAIPAADVAPVVHGRWEELCCGKVVVCSVCGSEFDNTCNYDIRKDWNGCPKCLARIGKE